MNNRIICILLAVLLLAYSMSFSQTVEQSSSTLKVFTDWGEELVMDIHKGKLRIRKLKNNYISGVFQVDGLRFKRDEKLIEAIYGKHNIERRLTVKDGILYFDREPVKLPRKLQAYAIYQAILWNGWIICLGRTSYSDSLSDLRPPFIATELITFSASQRVARTRQLISYVPTDIRLYVLEGEQQR